MIHRIFGDRRALRRIGLAALLAATAVPAVAQSLTDTFVLAYRNSGLLEQNRALLRAADEDVAQAVSALYPVINWAVDTGYFDNGLTTNRLTATANLTAQITLYDGGQNRLAIDAAQENVLAVREGLVAVEQQVLLAAVQAHMDVLSAAETVSLRQNNVQLITRELGASRDRFEVGEITRTDVSLAEARLALARSQLSVAEGDLATAREAYKRAVGVYPTGLQVPGPAPMPATTSDEAKARATRAHPAVRQAKREVTVAEINAARLNASRNPSLTLGGRLGVDADTIGQNVPAGQRRADLVSRSLSLGLSGPIYQGGRIDSLVRQQVARSEAARANLLLTADQVAETAGSAFARLLVANAVLESSRRQVTAQQQFFSGTREEANLGARTTLDVLNAEQDLLDARTLVVTATNDRVVAQYALLAAQGLLTVDYLNLGIPTYDPAAYYNAVESAPVASRQGQALDRVLKSLKLEDR